MPCRRAHARQELRATRSPPGSQAWGLDGPCRSWPFFEGCEPDPQSHRIPAAGRRKVVGAQAASKAGPCDGTRRIVTRSSTGNADSPGTLVMATNSRYLPVSPCRTSGLLGVSMETAFLSRGAYDGRGDSTSCPHPFWFSPLSATCTSRAAGAIRTCWLTGLYTA